MHDQPFKIKLVEICVMVKVEVTLVVIKLPLQ